jgi:hypothetical protein
MSAKHSKKGGQKPAQKSATPAPAAESVSGSAGGIPAPVSGSAPGSASAATAAEPHVAWMDSSDPKKRMIGKIVFVGVWIYVAALWLLALDQTFHWGIFGPKVPPVP